jgi:hypothetical protein
MPLSQPLPRLGSLAAASIDGCRLPQPIRRKTPAKSMFAGVSILAAKSNPNNINHLLLPVQIRLIYAMTACGTK